MEPIRKELPDGTSYRITGKGKPVMLVHGFAETGLVWRLQEQELSSSWQIIVPDLPGSGYSVSALHRLQSRTIEGMAERLMAIVLKEDIGSLSMLGHSMGGYITLAFAEKYPEKLNGFGLIHSTAYADSEEKRTTRERSVEFIQKHGAFAFLEQLIPNLYGEKFRKDNPVKLEEQLDLARHLLPEVLISYYRMMMERPNRISVLTDFQKPILFIIGKEDKAVNLDDSLAQCYLPAESHVHILETSGHMGMHEQAIKTNRAVKEFLVHLNEN